MNGRLARALDGLSEHYTVACMVLALAAATLLGVGDVRVVCAMGLALCVVGLAQSEARVDPWSLVPLLLYCLWGMLSALVSYGNATDGYGATHLLFPVLALLYACLGEEDARLLRRLCVLWAGAAAALGILQFVFRAAVWDRSGRLGGLLGNPNAMGIFLVLGWFALLRCAAETPAGGWRRVFTHLEPLLLAALALTLSMGSFVAMAAGLLVLAAEYRRQGWREVFAALLRLLARIVLGVGTGLLLYLGAARTGVPWISVVLLAYLAALTAGWGQYARFLEARSRMAAALAGAGFLVTAAVIAVRPGALATFSERLAMMQSGFRYLTARPLVGVGPYRWRMLDLQDGGIYFATWHIHNALLHVGVELGLPAMALLAWAAARFWKRRDDAAARAGLGAFFVHNLMDTSFFYLGITSFALLAGGNAARRGRRLAGARLKWAFGLLAALFAFHLGCILVLGTGV